MTPRLSKSTPAIQPPAQHHNPIELFATQCVWNGSQLTVHEPSQNVYGIKNGLAAQLGIEPSQIRVISRYVGGAFGSKGALTQRTAIVAVAAAGSAVRSSLSRPASKASRFRRFAPRRGSACSSPLPGTESFRPSVTKDQRSRPGRSLRGRRHRRFDAHVRLPQCRE